MTELFEQKCTPCEGGVKPLDLEAAQAMMSLIDARWELAPDGKSLSREYRFPAFSRTIGFVNAIAWIATVEGHHPDLQVGYGRCHVTYTTHAIGGLSQNDFICAAKIDRLVAEQGTA
jgi:4a-hydroxytetrahydrobiopterin dehydratase